jgi:hypothetical protein
VLSISKNILCERERKTSVGCKVTVFLKKKSGAHTGSLTAVPPENADRGIP